MSTTGNIINIPAADVAGINLLLGSGPILVKFGDNTGQTAQIYKAVVSGSVGVVSCIVGSFGDGGIEPPLSHASGTPITSAFGHTGASYGIGSYSFITPYTPQIPGYIGPVLMFCDSFQHWTDNGGPNPITRKWQNGSTGGAVGTVTTPWGRGYQFGANAGLLVTFPLEVSMLTVGFRRLSSTGNSNALVTLGNPNGPTPSLVLENSTGGALQVVFGSSSPLPIPGFTQVNGAQYYYEMQATLSLGLRCDFHVRIWSVSGTVWTQVVSYTGFASQSNASNNKWSTVTFGAPGGGGSATIGDLYITTSAFLGNATISYLAAASAGAQTQGTVTNGPGPNWKMNSDGAVEDDNTTTVDQTTQGQRDLYGLQSVVQVPGKAIVAAQFIECGEHTGSSPSVGCFATQSEGTELDYGQFFQCYSQFVSVRRPSLMNLVTFNPWTWTDVNAAQAGFARLT